jgi:hypothetical protein
MKFKKIKPFLTKPFLKEKGELSLMEPCATPSPQPFLLNTLNPSLITVYMILIRLLWSSITGGFSHKRPFPISPKQVYMTSLLTILSPLY